MERIKWIDFTKSLMIFFVVLIHTHCNWDVVTTLKTVTMPMFFFMSGFLFSIKRNPTYSGFLYKRFRQLIVPYLWINFIAYFVWLFFLRKYGENVVDDIFWYKPLVGMALGIPPEFIHDVPLWSLLCFFLVEAVFYPIYKVIGNPLVISIIFFVIAGIDNYVFSNTMGGWPMCMAPLPASIAFYSLGYFMRFKGFSFTRQEHGNPILMISSLVVYLVCSNLNDRVSYFTGYFANYPLFVVSSFAGCVFFIQLCIMISDRVGELRIIKFISTGTLIICGFHLLMLALIKGMLLFVFKIEPNNLTDNLMGGIILAITAYALCLPIIYIVRTYFRPLVDK